MTEGWTIEAVLDEIDEARKTGDHNYEDEMLLKLDVAIRSRKASYLGAPRKLIIYVEKGVGGSLHWTNSNVVFDEVLYVESTALSVSEDAEMYEECHEVEQYILPDLEQINQRIEHARNRCKVAAKWREENL